MAEQSIQSKPRKEDANPQSRGLERRQGSYDLFRNDPFWSTSDLFAVSPFALMRRFAENMEHAFSGNWEAGFGREQPGMWSPAIDVSQRGDRLVVRADLPGLSQKDVKVESGELAEPGIRGNESHVPCRGERGEISIHPEFGGRVRSNGKLFPRFFDPDRLRQESEALIRQQFCVHPPSVHITCRR